MWLIATHVRRSVVRVIDKMDELIEMPLGDTRVGQRSQVSDGNAHWHHLVNTNERSLRCVDAALSHQFAIISSLAQKQAKSALGKLCLSLSKNMRNATR